MRFNKSSINDPSIYRTLPDFDYWMLNYAIPHGVNTKIISFLKSQTNHLYFLEDESNTKPWASPRSWSRFSDMLNAMEAYIQNVSITNMEYVCKAHVGSKAASEFAAYYEIYSKMQLEMNLIFNLKKDIIIPNNNTNIYCICASNEYIKRINTNNIIGSIAIISQIIAKLGISNVEISIEMLNNISDYEYDCQLFLHLINEEVKKIAPEIDSKITKTITDVFGSLRFSLN